MEDEKTIITAECSICGREESYEMDEKEAETYYQ